MPVPHPARLLVGALLASAVLATPAHAFNYVKDNRNTWWGVQDAAAPRVDTGSIRATQGTPGISTGSGAYSTQVNGYGGIRVRVVGSEPRFNGELMRGFGLRFDGLSRFRTTRAVPLGGIEVARQVWVNRTADWARWFDSFTNTTNAPISLEVAFGGQLGVGDTGTTPTAVADTSSGDATVTDADTWVAAASPTGTGSTGGPVATVLGNTGGGAFDRTGSFLRDTFTAPFPSGGHEGNFQSYVHTLTVAPGETASLVHFVVAGVAVTSGTAAAELTRVTGQAEALATTPPVGDLTDAEQCSIVNLTVTGPDCSAVGSVGQIPVGSAPEPVTSAGYDVVGKTIQQLRADMAAGVTTSQEITRAYLDRIAAYDTGQLGFNAMQTIASDAMAQAAAADDARKAGDTRPLLGIPIAFKDLFHTKDMPTTNGALTFEGFRPAEDAYQVAKIREAGAVVLGKASMEEYATSGSYSDSAYGSVWNAFSPSKSALASSGGSAVSTALSFNAASFGSQTGDSLYAPAAAASLVTLRGTDGMQSIAA